MPELFDILKILSCSNDFEESNSRQGTSPKGGTNVNDLMMNIHCRINISNQNSRISWLL